MNEMKSETCSECRKPIEHSMGADFHLCQDCWEAECSDMWWRMYDHFPGAVIPVEEKEPDGQESVEIDLSLENDD